MMMVIKVLTERNLPEIVTFQSAAQQIFGVRNYHSGALPWNLITAVTGMVFSPNKGEKNNSADLKWTLKPQDDKVG